MNHSKIPGFIFSPSLLASFSKPSHLSKSVIRSESKEMSSVQSRCLEQMSSYTENLQGLDVSQHGGRHWYHEGIASARDFRLHFQLLIPPKFCLAISLGSLWCHMSVPEMIRRVWTSIIMKFFFLRHMLSCIFQNFPWSWRASASRLFPLPVIIRAFSSWHSYLDHGNGSD